MLMNKYDKININDTSVPNILTLFFGTKRQKYIFGKILALHPLVILLKQVCTK